MAIHSAIEGCEHREGRRSEQQGRLPPIAALADGPGVADHLIVGVGVALHPLHIATLQLREQRAWGVA